MCVYVYIIYTYIRYIIHKYFVYIKIFIYTGIIYSICINVYYVCKYTNVYIVI